MKILSISLTKHCYYKKRSMLKYETYNLPSSRSLFKWHRGIGKYEHVPKSVRSYSSSH